MPEFVQQFAEWIALTGIAQAIAGSGYLFPILEIVHVIGLTLVIGTVAIVDVRLLGWGSTARTVRDLSRQMLPLSWGGFVIALLSGVLLFASNATVYIANPAFQYKVLFLALAGLNMLVFHLRTWRSVAQWDDAPRPPAAARLAGALSLACWVVIVFLGRWIGFIL